MQMHIHDGRKEQRHCCFLIGICLVGMLASTAAGQAPWHLAEWGERAVLSIAAPQAGNGVDTAVVKILCQGRAQPDADDYRVIDDSGNPVPYLVVFHDAERYSLIAFRAANPAGVFHVYFDNPNAGAAAERAAFPDRPGEGPPRGDWIPCQGLFLETRARPPVDNPRDVDELAAMLAASPARYGARLQRRISDGSNPFGPSDMYMSLYRGWMRIDEDGLYWFCTASNEASFSFVDGRELVHWPGRHTEERGSRGEKNASIQLSAGLHFIEYYHEEVALQQMAFLGWRGRNASGPFTAIPEAVYTEPHRAEVVRYERAEGDTLHFEPALLDSVWPAPPRLGQAVRCRFDVVGDGDVFSWAFGDGAAAEGRSVEHVFFHTGVFPVTVTGPSGARAAWPLEIYEIQHVTDEVGQGSIEDFLRRAEAYDIAALDEESRVELALWWAETGKPERVLALVESVSESASAAVHGLAARCAEGLGADHYPRALQHAEAVVALDTNPVARLDALAMVVRLEGVGDLAAATDALQRAHEIIETHPPTGDLIGAYRKALDAAGDAYSWHGLKAEALDHYLQAEALNEPIPLPVRAARTGSYPHALGEHLEAGDLVEAEDLLDRWEDVFPADKAKGQTHFWRARVCLTKGEPLSAIRHLRHCIDLAEGAPFETEARWRLAQAYRDQGQDDRAREQLRLLTEIRIRDEYVTKATRELKQPAGPNSDPAPVD